MYSAFRSGRGTRDLCGPAGLTTEQFVDWVAEDINLRMATGKGKEVPVPSEEKKVSRFADTKAMADIDQEAVRSFFEKFDTNGDGSISFDEFVDMTIELSIAPLKADVLAHDDVVQEQKFRMESMNVPA